MKGKRRRREILYICEGFIVYVQSGEMSYIYL
jgi:hypothetical protein